LVATIRSRAHRVEAASGPMCERTQLSEWNVPVINTSAPPSGIARGRRPIARARRSKAMYVAIPARI
jgi:hypothetical protein